MYQIKLESIFMMIYFIHQMSNIIFISSKTLYDPYYQSPSIYKKLHEKLEELKKNSISLIYAKDNIPKLSNAVVISINSNTYNHCYPHYKVDHPGDTYYMLNKLYPKN